MVFVLKPFKCTLCLKKQHLHIEYTILNDNTLEKEEEVVVQNWPALEMFKFHRSVRMIWFFSTEKENYRKMVQIPQSQSAMLILSFLCSACVRLE